MMSCITNKLMADRTVTTPIADPEGFITKEEVASRLKKTTRTIETWQRRGYVPSVKIGQSVLYRWSDIVEHLEKHFRVCHETPNHTAKTSAHAKVD